MSKFSVKKPLTVLVAVIITLVLGIVSYTSMTPDLLPNINLPYVIVATTYIGATPETVEDEVTKPMEQAMATLDNIETLSSTSSENYSMVILQFTEQANMDTITVDILQKINTISGSWDDMVGTPTIIKINPNMLPVMVAAVSYDDMDIAELSSFVQDTLINKLEGVTGVASISASGILAEEIQVVISQEKLDELNEQIFRAINGQFEEPEEELEELKDTIESGLGAIESGKGQLADASNEAAGAIAGGSATITEKQVELTSGKLAIEQQLTTLKGNEKELLATQKQLNELYATIQQLEKAKPELESAIALMGSYETQINQLIQSRKDTQQAIDLMLAAVGGDESLLENDPDYQLLKGTLAGIEGAIVQIDAALKPYGITVDTFNDAFKQAQDGLAEVNAGLAQIDGILAGMDMKRGDVAGAVTELDSGLVQLQDGIKQLETMLAGLESGQVQLSAALAELEKQKMSGILTMTGTNAQMIVQEASLKTALEQIEDGLDQMQDMRKNALEQADLHNVITLEMVGTILGAQDFSMPVGYVDAGGESVMVSVGDVIGSMDELENLLLFDLGLDGVGPIYLKDVAEVFIADNAAEIYANLNGSTGVLLSFSKQSNYATALVSDNLADAFASLEEEFPGLAFANLMDQGDYIYMIVQAVIQNLLMGAVLAVIVLFLFLRDLRPTFITLVSIPISVLFAFVLMYFSGVTLNMLSLSGLAVAVGMLVDNSVVVIENIYRLRNKGVPAVQAAVAGAKQVGGAIASSTLTTVAIFLPIVFVDGLTKDLFTDFALTFAFALIASLIIALTVVPSLSARMLREEKAQKHPLMDRLLAAYEKLLGRVLNHKAVVLVAVTALLVGSLLLTLARGFTFMPAMDMGQLTVTLEMPEDTELPETAAAADAVVDKILQIDGVGTVGAMKGGSGLLSGGGSDTSITMYVLLDENTKRSAADIGDEILERTEGLPGEVTASTSSGMDISMLAGSGVSVRLYSDNLDELRETAQALALRLESVDGVIEVDDGIDETSPALRVVVDKNKAMAEGLTVAQVYMALATEVTNSATVTKINDDGYTYDVIVDMGDEATVGTIRGYTFITTDEDGEEVDLPLTAIAEIIETETLNSISRSEQQRYLSVSATISDDYNVTLVANEISAVVEGFDMPGDMRYEFSGENETIMESLIELMKMMGLGVLLVYLIMVAQFQSLKSPFIVMFTIPLAFTGGLIALFITGFEISIISLIGFIMLVGIIVNNGIVLVDYINQLRAEGVATREAVIEAGTTRMRPILMTTITTIFGLLTMALGMGSGGAMMQPIAIVCIGGLTYATILTLFVVPVMYEMMNRKELHVVTDEELEYEEE